MNVCPHAVHKNRRTPLYIGGKIVDMSGVIAVVSAALSLAALPRRLALLVLVGAGVESAVEVVFRELAFDITLRRL